MMIDALSLIRIVTALLRDPNPADCAKCEVVTAEHCSCIAGKNIAGPAKIDCSNAGLQKVPQFSRICGLSQTTYIDLSNNQITQLTSRDFAGVHFDSNKHVEIDLSNNKINYINADAVQNLMHVSGLNLSGNQLGAEFDSLPGNWEALKNIVTLDLSANSLDTVPPDICKIPNLRDLYFDENKFESDLSAYIPILVKCKELKKLQWARDTMRCTCKWLKHYPAPVNPLPTNRLLTNYSLPAFRKNGVYCDRSSSPAFRQRQVKEIQSGLVFEHCGFTRQTAFPLLVFLLLIL